ncbi:signal transduction histidine kinase [Lipingzhangella halophila]|uniref:histidine kinase n=1 Tax=Lipingzhangella halophila TaxID=1783352 RepID=A0A7W7RHZ9_9ACTN|nr:sensor histidine kinase [Lipingzhangella halophila]MBB4932349.1 signal transduction histidine kinase [Lipingzhangella halophila]
MRDNVGVHPEGPPPSRAPGWRLPGVWPAAAGVLGAAAVAEAVLRAPGTGSVQAAALLVGLTATVPLAFVRGHLAAVLGTIAAATAMTHVLYGWPTVTAMTALLAAGTAQLRHGLGGLRARAAERDAAAATVEHTRMELMARGERARIARELHDVVAHHISLISVQAETARLTTPGMPEEGARQLRAVGDTARTALTEMRRLLGVLREDAAEGTDRAPQPGLGQVLELVDEVRGAARAGTRLIVRGPVAPLDAGVELAAYRIIQEALTNARRHAPGACVDVELDYHHDGLRVRVRDNGPGPGPEPSESGHGLGGMRERAAAVGGRLRTAAPPVGGFCVEAALPCERDEEMSW